MIKHLTHLAHVKRTILQLQARLLRERLDQFLFMSSSEWAMVFGRGLVCLRQMICDHIHLSPACLLSPLYSSSAHLTVLLLPTILCGSTNRVSSALATVSHYHIPAGMRGNVLICEAGLFRLHYKDVSNDDLFQKPLNEQAKTPSHFRSDSPLLAW